MAQSRPPWWCEYLHSNAIPIITQNERGKQIMDKVILRRQRKRASDNLYRVRISGECYEEIEELSERTNMSMTEIASKLLAFALLHTEVEEDKA